MRLAPRVAALHTLIIDRWPGGTEDRLCAELAAALPGVIRQMWAITADGYPTSTSGASGKVGGRSSSPPGLLGIVEQREVGHDAYDALGAFVGTATASVAFMDRQGVRTALQGALKLTHDWNAPLSPVALEQARKASRCAAETSESLEPWVRPECDNLAAKTGLCHACYMRRRRWKAEQQEMAN